MFQLFCNRNKIEDRKHKLHGAASLSGYKSNDSSWVNQDNYLIEIQEPDFETGCQNVPKCTVCVFDGHGPNGHKISGFCKTRIMTVLEQCNGRVVNTFSQLQKELDEGNMDADQSGTTCTMICIRDGFVNAHNVGDSQAFLGRRQGANGGLQAILLTIDHKPSSSDEADRIKKEGGVIHAKIVQNEEKKDAEGPVRVWYQPANGDGNKSIGLAMSRSLGDCSAHKVGVSCEPSETIEKLTPYDEFIILGSDGLTDAISPQEATMMIDHYMSSLPPEQHRFEWDAQEAAKILVSEARRRWVNSSHIDDITCCVIKLRDAQNHFFLK